MSGFIRRFTNFPPQEVLTEIEGINIIDLPPPSAITGVGTGIACLVGEFQDMTFAVEINPTTGAITSFAQPVDIFTSQDLLNKTGGFDETLGQFGGDMGNGFVELRNKRFSRLVVVPVNLASSAGVRVWRTLPTNTSATDATPVTAMTAAQVAAGREFKDGVDKLRLAQSVLFTSTAAFVDGVDGSVTSAGAAATQTFTSAGSTFETDEVAEGDALVLGVIGGAGPLGANAATYRVVSVTDETNIVVQKQDGTNFDWTTGAALPFRIHQGETADSGPDNQFSEQPGYLVPVRPLTDGQGTGSDAGDGSWTVSTLLSPVVVPAAATATTTDPLSGLSAATGPTTTVDFDADVQKANAPNSASIDALYATAFDSLLSEESPARDVNLVWAARKSDTIRTKVKTHVLDASAVGIGRTGATSPELDIAKATAIATVTGDAAPGVGANRDERVDYDWPGLLTVIPEAVNFKLATADGLTTEDGDLDTTSDGWLISIMSNLAPERNPGEGSQTVRRVMAPVAGFARNTPTLDIDVYKLLKQKGIAAPRRSRTLGFLFQSGITSSITDGQKNINRRRMADFIEDSIAQALSPLAKLPLTNDLIDTIVTQTNDFLSGLLSQNNPPAQRIDSFDVDEESGNTPELTAKGIFVIIVKVRTLATADFITIQAEIGEGVVTTATLS